MVRDLTYIYTEITLLFRSNQRFEDTSWRCESIGLNRESLIRPFHIARRIANVTASPPHIEKDELRFFFDAAYQGQRDLLQAGLGLFPIKQPNYTIYSNEVHNVRCLMNHGVLVKGTRGGYSYLDFLMWLRTWRAQEGGNVFLYIQIFKI